MENLTTAPTTLTTNTQLLPYTARGPATRGRKGQSRRVNQNGKKTSQEALPPLSILPLVAGISLCKAAALCWGREWWGPCF